MEIKKCGSSPAFCNKGVIVNKSSEAILKRSAPNLHKVFESAIDCYDKETSRIWTKFNITDLRLIENDDGTQALVVDLTKPPRYGRGAENFSLSSIDVDGEKIYLPDIEADNPNEKFIDYFKKEIVKKFQQVFNIEPELTFKETMAIGPGPSEFKGWHDRGDLLCYEDELPASLTLK